MKYIVQFKKWLLDKPGFIYRLYFLVLVLGILGFVDYKYALSSWPLLRFLGAVSIIKSSSDLILFWTFLVIILYTIETYRLRDETYSLAQATLEANRSAHQPGLTMRWMRPNNGDWVLILTNQGKGTALNIEIVTDNNEFEIDCGGVNAIYQGDAIGVDIKKDNRKLTHEEIDTLSESPLNVVIKFSSMENLSSLFSTKIEVKNPPHAKITETHWR